MIKVEKYLWVALVVLAIFTIKNELIPFMIERWIVG